MLWLLLLTPLLGIVGVFQFLITLKARLILGFTPIVWGFAYGLEYIVEALSSAIIGSRVVRLDTARRILLVLIVLCAIGFHILSLIDDKLLFILIYYLVGFSIASALPCIIVLCMESWVDYSKWINPIAYIGILMGVSGLSVLMASSRLGFYFPNKILPLLALATLPLLVAYLPRGWDITRRLFVIDRRLSRVHSLVEIYDYLTMTALYWRLGYRVSPIVSSSQLKSIIGNLRYERGHKALIGIMLFMAGLDMMLVQLPPILCENLTLNTTLLVLSGFHAGLILSRLIGLKSNCRTKLSLVSSFIASLFTITLAHNLSQAGILILFLYLLTYGFILGLNDLLYLYKYIISDPLGNPGLYTTARIVGCIIGDFSSGFILLNLGFTGLAMISALLIVLSSLVVALVRL